MGPSPREREREREYSFRAWMADLALWTMVTDLAPHQQAASILLALKGAAREHARSYTPQQLRQGGIVGNQHVDPVTFILAGLHARWAPLEEESRLAATTELLAFCRNPGGTVNSVLARYEVCRQRAAIEGQFAMPMQGQMLQLLIALGTTPSQMVQLLQPTGGQLPTNEADFNTVCLSIRRYGHITENHPGNIGQALHGPMRPARPGAYHTNEHSGQHDPNGQPNADSYPVQSWSQGPGGPSLVHDPYGAPPTIVGFNIPTGRGPSTGPTRYLVWMGPDSKPIQPT